MYMFLIVVCSSDLALETKSRLQGKFYVIKIFLNVAHACIIIITRKAMEWYSEE